MMVTKTIVLKDEKTGVVVEKEGGDTFAIHLGNRDFALEMSKAELIAIQALIAEILEN